MTIALSKPASQGTRNAFRRVAAAELPCRGTAAPEQPEKVSTCRYPKVSTCSDFCLGSLKSLYYRQPYPMSNMG